MKIFLIIVGFALVSELLKFVAKVVKHKLDNANLKTEVSLLKAQLNTANRIIHDNNVLISQMARRESVFNYENHSASKDEIEAVRYAMKKSHPDNGGNAEDFMRFKKCYEELTRR